MLNVSKPLCCCQGQRSAFGHMHVERLYNDLREERNIQSQWCGCMCCLSKSIVWSSGHASACPRCIFLLNKSCGTQWEPELSMTWSDVTVLLTPPCWPQQCSFSDGLNCRCTWLLDIFAFLTSGTAATTTTTRRFSNDFCLTVDTFSEWPS